MNTILYFILPLTIFSFIGLFYFSLRGLNQKLNRDLSTKKEYLSLNDKKPNIERMEKDINSMKFQVELLTKLIISLEERKKSSEAYDVYRHENLGYYNIDKPYSKRRVESQYSVRQKMSNN